MFGVIVMLPSERIASIPRRATCLIETVAAYIHSLQKAKRGSFQLRGVAPPKGHVDASMQRGTRAWPVRYAALYACGVRELYATIFLREGFAHTARPLRLSMPSGALLVILLAGRAAGCARTGCIRSTRRTPTSTSPTDGTA